MRIWRKAGFADLAQAILEDIQYKRPDMASWALAVDQSLSTIGVVLVADQSAMNAWEQAQLEQSLRENQVRVLEPQALPEIAREHDLHLTGAFEPLQQVAYLPLLVDAVIQIHPDTLSLWDATTGAMLGETTRSEDWKATVAALMNQAAEHRGSRTATQADPDVIPRPTQLPPGAKTVEGNIQRDRFALLLELFIQEPHNLDYITALYHRSDNAVQLAMYRRAIAMILAHPDTPHAPAWLMSISWQRAKHEYYNLPRHMPQPVKLEHEKSIPERYAELLAHFPDSLEAGLVNYGLAHELMDQGDYAQALDALLRLEQFLDTATFSFPTNDLREATGFQTRFQYALARAYHRQGDLEKARHRVRLALKAIEASRAIYMGPSSDYAVYRSNCCEDTPRWSVKPYLEYSQRQKHAQALTYSGDPRPEIRALAMRLDSDEPDFNPNAMTSQEAFAAAMQTSGEEAYALHVQSMEAYLSSRAPDAGNIDLPDRVLFQLAWLYQRVQGDAERMALDNLTDRLMAVARSHDDILRFNQNSRRHLRMIAGRIERQQHHLEVGLNSTDIDQRVMAILQQAELDSLLLPPLEQGIRLRDNIRVFEEDFPSAVLTPELVYCFLVEAAGPMLMATGQAQEAYRLYSRQLDRNDAPQVYHLRTRYNMARAKARMGEVFEATEMLRKASDELSRVSDDSFRWQPRDDVWMHASIWRRAGIDNQATLARRIHEQLRELRQYGGYEEVFPSKPEQGAAVDASRAARMYAYLFLYNDRSGRFSDLAGGSHLMGDREAGNALRVAGQEDPQLVRDLANAWFLDPRKTSLVQTHQFHVLRVNISLGTDQFPDITSLTRMARWPEICSVQRFASWMLAYLGPDAAQAIPSLILQSATACPACRSDILVAIEQIGTPSPDSAATLRRMLQHHDAGVRRLAAGALARLLEIAVPYEANGVPSLEAVVILENWLASPEGVQSMHNIADRTRR